MFDMTERITLSPPERRELKRMSRSRSARHEDVRRANILRNLAAGAQSLRQISRAQRCSVNTVRLWRDRFLAERLPGLFSRHRGRQPELGSEKIEARIIHWTLHRKPADGSTHWSSRKLAQRLGLNHVRVARVWAKAGLQPHRRRHYMTSDDPHFETKGADIIALYLRPPAHAAVFCVDEKSALQALDRLDRVLPLSPGRAERHGFEYFRHGTLSHPQVHLHFTPTYSSWLNQVEIWFSKIQRDLIARGIFQSKADLSRKLMRYIRHYNQAALPFKWTYQNVAKRIR